MAAKIKEGLKDITQGVVDRLKGGPKYADNLLGDSLQDQLRKATAKELLQPSEERNSEVVETINQDIANGKDSRDIVVLLKKRLRTDNPQKQWLAVQLVGRVMRDCAAALGPHEEELLREVATAMTRPAKPETDAGKATRKAAIELLRSYGRAGKSAFRAAHRSAAPNPHEAVAAEVDAAASAEASSVVAEVQQLIEQAQANTELLSEMLLTEQRGGAAAAAAGGAAGAGAGAAGGSSGAGAASGPEVDEITEELVTEIRELRGLFDAYLEQMQSMSGPAVEAALIRALEAVDMLDGALALQRDVASNQLELEHQATGGGSGGSGSAPGGSGSAGPAAAAAAAGAAPAPAGNGDLISLDDFSLPQPPPVLGGAPPAAEPRDPFAASDYVPMHPVGSPPAGLVPPPSAPQPQPQPHAYPPANNAHLYGQPPQPTAAQLQQPQQQWPHLQPQQQHAMYGGYHQQPQPHYPQQQQLPSAYAPYGQVAAAQPYGGAAPYNPFSGAGGASVPQAAAVPAGYGAQPAAAVASSSNPFSAAPQPAQQGAPGIAPSASVENDWTMFFADRAGGPQQKQ